jgi:hypothetical protein
MADDLSAKLPEKTAPVERKILSYHPEIHVERDGDVHVLKFAVPDWSPEEVLLRDLAKRLNATTVGEIVEKLTAKKAATLEKMGPVASTYVRGDHDLWPWAKKIE